jgi:tetratricopeptide (TPR) repeat protein
MQDNAVTAARRLLPRWRSLARTPTHELITARVKRSRRTRRAAIELENAVARWNETKALGDASDVVDAAIVSGNYSVAAPVARFILADGNGVSGLNDAAKQILGEVTDRPEPELTPTGERTESKIIERIRALKRRLYYTPRDALSALEIARLQALMGQTRAAAKYIEYAIKLAPNDRYILRSATRFWASHSMSERALEAIWASDVVRIDPWVQAAEVAAATMCDRSPRWAAKKERELISQGHSSVQYSELAGGLATLELHAGSSLKKIRALTRLSLRSPTENALAQAVWVRHRVGFDFDVDSYLKSVPNANEAATRAAYEVGDYQASAEACWKWLGDENFSARAALAGSFITTCLLGHYSSALEFVEQGLRANPGEPMLWNNKIVALAYLGRAREAENLLPQLDGLQDHATIKPFVQAAHGLVAFRLGNIARGRECYRRAILLCNELANGRLAANATNFWLEQELFARTIDQEEAEETIRKLDEYHERQRKDERSPVWHVRKKLVLKMIERNTALRTDLQKSIERYRASALSD